MIMVLAPDKRAQAASANPSEPAGEGDTSAPPSDAVAETPAPSTEE